MYICYCSYELLSLDAQLMLSTFELDLESNTIRLVFSESMQLNATNNGEVIDSTAIFLGPIAGDIGMAVQFPSSVSCSQSNSSQIYCYLGSEFRSILNANPALGTGINNTFLYYDSSEATGGNGNESGILIVDTMNRTFSETNGFQATVIVLDFIPPIILALGLDLNVRFIHIIFSQPVNISTWNFTDLYYMINGSTSDPTIAPLTINSNDITTDQSGHHVTLFLSQRDFFTILTTGPYYDIIFNHTTALVEDFGGNPVNASLSIYGIPTYIYFDYTRPSLISCYLDLSLHQLILNITEPIDINSFMLDEITIQNFPNVSLASSTYTLTGGNLTIDNNATVVINLLSSDAEIIRSFITSESSAYLSLASSSFTDYSNNSVTPVSGFQCSLSLG